MITLDNFEERYDFSCWVVKYGRISINGKTYQKDSLKNNAGMTVPLFWNHNHREPFMCLGYAHLENREDGIFAYCTLDDTAIKESVIQLIQNRGLVSLSPFITHVKTDEKSILHGLIREVSLVPARVDPDESYYPVMRIEAVDVNA